MALKVNVRPDPTGARADPDVSVSAGLTSVRLSNGGPGEEEEEDDEDGAALSTDFVRFDDRWRAAADWEERAYLERCDGTDAEDLKRDRAGRALVEEWSIALGRMEMRIPPSLHFGEVIDDLSATPKLIAEGMRAMGLAKRRGGGRVQRRLMTIRAEIPFVDAAFLEEKFENHEIVNARSEDGSACFDRLRLQLEGVVLVVRRFTPVSALQTILNDLDADKSRSHVYGPVFQGGDLELGVRHALCVLSPLTLVTPLAALRNLRVGGQLYMAGLSPDTEGLMLPGDNNDFLLNCHHHVCRNIPNSRACRVHEYGLTLPSNGLPAKTFLNLRVSVEEVDATYGLILLESIPPLLRIIQRLTPPKKSSAASEPPLEGRDAPPQLETPALGWWDNLRFLVQGSLELSIPSLSFRFLLDSPVRYDWSILITLEDCSIRHTAGRIGLDVCNLVISVPGLSYQLTIADVKEGSDDANSDGEGDRIDDLAKLCGFDRRGGRHSLLLVPRLTLDLHLSWSVDHPAGASGAFDHHSPYMRLASSGVDTLNPTLNADKFRHFRSCAVDLELSVSLPADDMFANWVALRVDVLPWLTHKILATIPTPTNGQSERDGPGPLPKVGRLAMSISVSNLRIGMWFEDGDSSAGGTGPKMSAATGGGDGDVDKDAGSACEGFCLKVKALRYESLLGDEAGSTHIHVDGPVQACLLDIGEDMIEEVNTMSTPIDEDVRLFDHIAASFGFGEERMAPVEGGGDGRHLDRETGSQSLRFDDESRRDIQHLKRPDGRRHLERQDRQLHLERQDGRRRLERQDGRQSTYLCKNMIRNSPQAFRRVQAWSQLITELDYLLVVDQINIVEQSLEELSSNGGVQVPMAGLKKSTEMELQQTWTVLVDGMKLLWTLELRDLLLPLVQDLIFTLNTMKLGIREAKTRLRINIDGEGDNASPEVLPSKGEHSEYHDLPHGISNDSSQSYGSILVHDDERNSFETELRSSLDFLLQKGTATNTDIPCADEAGASVDRPTQVSEQVSETANTRDTSIPTLDIHLSNPQIQLHSEKTGGSIILAMRGAYVEGRTLINLFSSEPLLSRHSKYPPLHTLLRKTEYCYTLDSMEVYAVTSGVDVGAGLQWLEVANREEDTKFIARDAVDGAPASDLPSGSPLPDEAITLKTDLGSLGKSSLNRMQHERTVKIPVRRFPSHLEHHKAKDYIEPILLKKIMTRCTFQSMQSLHLPPIDLSDDELIQHVLSGLVLPLWAKEDSCGTKLSAPEPIALDQVKMNIDELAFNLDAHQFQTTLDLIRNVILAPPKTLRHQWKQTGPSDSSTNREAGKERADSFTSEDKGSFVVRDMRQQWGPSTHHRKSGKKTRDLIRSEAKELLLYLEDRQAMLVETTTIRCIQYTLNKAKWKVQSPDFLDDVEINFTGFRGQHDFLKDGSVISQISLDDVRVISEKPGPHSLRFDDPTSVITTVIEADASCVRCGVHFDKSTNESSSCVFHTGEFAFSSNRDRWSWSCCQNPMKNSIGCYSQPHRGKEKAAEVRLEALPQSAPGLTLYKHVEVNIYPNVLHTIVVQITKDLAGLFLAYFLGEDGKEGIDQNGIFDNDTSSSRSQVDKLDAISDLSDSAHSRSSQKKTVLIPSKASSKKTILLRSQGSRTSINSAATSSTNVSPSSVSLGDAVVTKPKQTQEVIFIKFLRVGHIKSSISLVGFPVVTSGLGILVPAFSRAYKVGTVNYLGHKYLSHLIHEILKSAASSGMEKVKDKIRGRNTQTFENLDRKGGIPENESVTESYSISDSLRRSNNEARRIDLLLGSPLGKKKHSHKGPLRKGK